MMRPLIFSLLVGLAFSAGTTPLLGATQRWINPVLSSVDDQKLLAAHRRCRRFLTRRCQSDLIVAAVYAGTGYVGSDGVPRIPLRITIKNIGIMPSPAVKVSLQGAHQQNAGEFSLPVEAVLGTNALMGVITPGSIGVAQTQTISLNARFRPSWSGQPIHMRAKADSCIAEPSFPTYCRAAERNENNNMSGVVSMTIP